MVEPKTEAGRMIRRARAAVGLSQKELAERVGMDQGQFSLYERGRIDPRVGYLSRILKACGYKLVVKKEKEEAWSWEK